MNGQYQERYCAISLSLVKIEFDIKPNNQQFLQEELLLSLQSDVRTDPSVRIRDVLYRAMRRGNVIGQQVTEPSVIEV